MPAKFIARCTPSLGMVSIWWSRLVESIVWPMNTGKGLFYKRDGEGGEIAETRNTIVNDVLTWSEQNRGGSYTHLFWVDDDVLVFPMCLMQLLSHDKPIVSGVYFNKLPGKMSAPLIFPDRYGGTSQFTPNEVKPIWGHGMGLTLVKTEVYSRMRDELNLPLDKYGRPQWYKTAGSNLEDIEQAEDGTLKLGYTEDLWFLENAAKLGYTGCVDQGKHTFGFHYDAAKDIGYPEEQWNQWIRSDCITWQTKDGEVVWD